MARKAQKAGKARKAKDGKSAQSYDHREEKLLLGPDIGLQPQFKLCAAAPQNLCPCLPGPGVHVIRIAGGDSL